jgi:hypothetical protein
MQPKSRYGEALLTSIAILVVMILLTRCSVRSFCWGDKTDAPPGEAVRVLSPAPEPAGETASVGAARTDTEVQSGSVPSQAGLPGFGGSLPLAQRDFLDGILPTEEGLYSLTLARWSDEAFLNLTTERARALLPVAADEIGTMPGTLRGALSLTLPTNEEIHRAFAAPAAQEALRASQWLSLRLVDLELVPLERRTEAFSRGLGWLEDERARLELEVMRECAKVCPYPSWVTLGRLYHEWAKP